MGERFERFDDVGITDETKALDWPLARRQRVDFGVDMERKEGGKK